MFQKGFQEVIDYLLSILLLFQKGFQFQEVIDYLPSILLLHEFIAHFVIGHPRGLLRLK